MDIQSVTSLIGTLGFPIIACIGLGWFVKVAFERIMGENESREEKLYTALTNAQDTNEKLTKTNAEFCEVLRAYKEDLQEIKDDVEVIKDKLC